MAFKEPSAPNRGCTAWAAGAIALVLAAGGGWLLNRATDAPALAAGPPAASVRRMLEPPLTEAKAEVAAAPASAAAPVARPSLRMPTQLTADELRNVQLALEGSASPADTWEAARILSICKGVDGAVESVYRLRDHADTGWRLLEQSPGFRTDKLIAEMQNAQRRCQIFDAATLARRGELLKRAYEGGAKDAALDYLLWLNAESKQTVNPELLGKLQREARQTAEDGDFKALVVYSHAFDPKLGATPVQRQAYKEAWLRVQTEMSGPAMAQASRDSIENLEKMMSQSGAAPPALSAEQQREADALTERVVGAWRKRQDRGG
jgi:hypothetical protein